MISVQVQCECCLLSLCFYIHMYFLSISQLCIHVANERLIEYRKAGFNCDKLIIAMQIFFEACNHALHSTHVHFRARINAIMCSKRKNTMILPCN